MHYLVTIGYKEETEKGVKVKKLKYVIEAESVEEATIIAAKYKDEDTIRDSESLSIVKMAIECVIDQKHNPHLYTS